MLIIFHFIASTIAQETGACIDETLAQSPIRLKPPFSHIELNLEFDFIEARDMHMRHTGKELVVQGTFGFIKHAGKVFNAYQVKFKSPSEHSLSENDYFYPLEMQIFLISQQKYRIGLIVFFKLSQDHTENPLLAKFGFGKNIIKDLSPGDIYLVPEPLNLNELFEPTDPFLVYQGSETVSPCGQMVWLALFKFYTMSSNQAVDFPETLLYKVREQKEMKRPIYANFDPALFVITGGDLNTKSELNKQRQRHQVDKKLVRDNFRIIGGDLELDAFVFSPPGQSGGKVVRTEDYFVIKVKPEAKDPQSEREDLAPEEAPNIIPEEQALPENSIPEEVYFEEDALDVDKEPENQNEENNQQTEHQVTEKEEEKKKLMDIHQRIIERQASKSDTEKSNQRDKMKQQKKEEVKKDQQEEGEQTLEIDYSNWPRLCKVGKQQSPILINPKTLVKQELSIPMLEYSIIPAETFMSHDGYALKLLTDSQGFGILKWNGVIYQANEINFHAPSEHAIGTEEFRAHCEVQIVHKSMDNQLLILVIFLHNTYPADRNQFLEAIGIPSTRSKGELVLIDKEIKLSELVSYADDFLTYTGSLTVPPCIEGVQYVIRRKRLPIGEFQIENLQRLIGSKANYRPLQNINGRIVFTV